MFMICAVDAMDEEMWRLHPRGAANRGVAVDIAGAMLGPICMLVEKTSYCGVNIIKSL
jgi:hypothetical protein